MQKNSTQKNRILRYVLPALGAAAVTGMLIPSQKVAAANDAGSNMAVYTLNSNDPSTYSTLKSKVIENLVEKDSTLSIDNIDVENSEMSVSGLNLGRTGIQTCTIKIGIAKLNDSTKSVGYSATETAAINVVNASAPILTLKKTNVVVNNGDAWNPSSYIATISDSSGTLPVLKETDNVDMSIDGDYYASFTAINVDGVSTTAVLNVTVKTPQEVKDANDAKTAADEAAKAAAERAKYTEDFINAYSLQSGNPFVYNAPAANAKAATYGHGMSALNPYPYGWTNCTYGVWELVYESTGIQLPGNLGDATYWLSSARSYGYATGDTPKVGSIAVYYNHVAYVAAVSADGSAVYIKEGTWYEGYNERWVSANYGTASNPLYGYIYLN